MQKYDVLMALEAVREHRAQWKRAFNTFNLNMNKVMDRLIHEAAVLRMSPEEVQRASGFNAKQVQRIMRRNNLSRRGGKTLLAKTAADALATNSELLGMAPHEMDLMSPLAYLPAGSELRQAITDKTTAPVTELDPVVEVAYLLWQVNQGYVLAEDRAVGKNWMYDDPDTMHEDDRKELPGWLDLGRIVLGLVSGNQS